MIRVGTVLASTCKVLAVLLSIFTVAALVAMFAALGIQIVSRNFFSTSILWLEDILLPGFIFVIFSGIALAFRHRSHLATTMLADSLPQGASRALAILVDVLAALTMAGVAWIGVQFAQNAFGQFSLVLRLPMGWAYLIIPFTAVASVLFILESNLTLTDKPQ